MIVVDTSAVMSVLWGEPTRPAILDVTRGHAITSSESMWWEVGNAIVKAVRMERYDEERAMQAFARFARMRPNLLLVVPDMKRSIEIGISLNTFAYDAYVLAVAAGSSAPLLTLDKAMHRHARTLGIKTVDV